MSRRNTKFNRVNKRDVPTNPERKVAKNDTNRRSNQTTRRIKMYSAKPQRDAKGEVISGSFMSKETAPGAGRTMADRRWFGNTRVVGQVELETFREEIKVAREDPYQLVLRQRTLPLTLLQEKKEDKRARIVEVEPFGDTFGHKATRKRPRLPAHELEGLASRAAAQGEAFVEKVIADSLHGPGEKDPLLSKGQSKRIWGELYKVLDSSDVVVQVLDARDPMGTRSWSVEKHLRDKCPTKQLVLVLNKCDLVPTWATARWIQKLSKVAPTLAFHAHLTRPFGKGNLINLLRQLAALSPEKKQISVGFVGYPNVGKSSLINALKSKKVCKTAPTPGETKVWQYVTLFKRVYLIDCPGTVPASRHADPSSIVLKGVTRVSALLDPISHVEALLLRAKPEHVRRTYGVRDWTDAEDLLAQLARRAGRLLKAGEPDIATAARGVIVDWQTGRLPYFVAPPRMDGSTVDPALLREQKLEELVVVDAMKDAPEEDGLDEDDGDSGDGSELQFEDDQEDNDDDQDDDEDQGDHQDEDDDSAQDNVDHEDDVDFEELLDAVKRKR